MFVQLPTDMVSPLLCKSCHFYLCLTSTLEREKWHIAITDSGVTVQHGVAARCSRTFTDYFSVFYEFSLHILVSYMENATELSRIVQTVATRFSLTF